LADNKGKGKDFEWIDQITVVETPSVPEPKEVEDVKSEMQIEIVRRAQSDKARKSFQKVQKSIISTGYVGKGKAMDMEIARAADELVTVRESDRHLKG